MDHVREVIRYQHSAYRTEQTYCQWILRYLHYFGGKTHPKLLGAKDVDFGQGLMFVRGGKGGKDRTTLLSKGVEVRSCGGRWRR